MSLEGVKVGADAVLGAVGGGHAVLQQVIDEAPWPGRGGSRRPEVCYKDTVEYSSSVPGQPIGKFQVLQHRIVDMFMEYEQAVHDDLAAMRSTKATEPWRRKPCPAWCVESGRRGPQAVQLHGGGMTEELNIGHYLQPGHDRHHFRTSIST